MTEGDTRARTSGAAIGRYPAGVTAQLPDVVELEGCAHAIAGIAGAGLFDPRDFGLEPVALSSACWRGFEARYAVRDGALHLARLQINLQGERPGRLPVAPTLRGRTGRLESSGKGSRMMLSASFTYEELGVMPFTGGLLLTDGFIEHLYVHMGFHPAWKFERVVELLIESGHVVASLDRSAALKEVRDRLSAEPLRPTSRDRDEVMGWIKRAFSLDYDWDASG